MCSKCCNQKASLKYNSGKESRICKECFRRIQVANASVVSVVADVPGGALGLKSSSGSTSSMGSKSTSTSSVMSNGSLASSSATLVNGNCCAADEPNGLLDRPNARLLDVSFEATLQCFV